MGRMVVTKIIKVEKFALQFEKFDNWVYVNCSDREDPFVLPRKFFDEQELKYSTLSYNWILDLTWAETYVALSKNYLKQYFEKGDWGVKNYDTWIVNPLPLLRRGIENRYYQADVSNSGFLTLNGEFVRRPYQLVLNDYTHKKKLVAKLLTNPKILSAEICQGYGLYLEDSYVYAVYMPAVQEFKRLTTSDSYDETEAAFDIIDRLNIQRFKRVDEEL